MMSSLGSADASLLLHFFGSFASLDLKVACFVFADSKRTFPNGLPFVRSSPSCLVPRIFFIVGGRQTLTKGMPTLFSIDFPQSSRGFVSNKVSSRGREESPLRN